MHALVSWGVWAVLYEYAVWVKHTEPVAFDS